MRVYRERRMKNTLSHLYITEKPRVLTADHWELVHR
jgi:hypothetical protein